MGCKRQHGHKRFQVPTTWHHVPESMMLWFRYFQQTLGCKRQYGHKRFQVPRTWHHVPENDVIVLMLPTNPKNPKEKPYKQCNRSKHLSRIPIELLSSSRICRYIHSHRLLSHSHRDVDFLWKKNDSEQYRKERKADGETHTSFPSSLAANTGELTKLWNIAATAIAAKDKSAAIPMHQCSRVRLCGSQMQFRRFWMLVGGRFSSSEPRRRSASLSLRGASASSSFNKTPAELWPLPPLLPGLDRRPTLDTSGPAEPEKEASSSHHHHQQQQQQQLQGLHNTHGMQFKFAGTIECRELRAPNRDHPRSDVASQKNLCMILGFFDPWHTEDDKPAHPLSNRAHST